MTSIGEKLSELHPRRFFLETWRDIDREAEEERRENASYDFHPMIALATGAIFLTLMEYFGHRGTLQNILDWMRNRDSSRELADAIRYSRYSELYDFVWWSGCRVLGYFIGPVLVVKLIFRERLRDHGLETRGFLSHAWIYAICYAVVLCCVVVVSQNPEFTDYYPFYKSASRSWFDFGAWELLYAAQFFSLEFFFRGFWLKACKRAMGSQAIYAMIVPYCMIHYGKPWLEALAAIVAGIVLGTLAMKTRSIWSGFLIHVSVAISMDVASILKTGHLPSVWMP